MSRTLRSPLLSAKAGFAEPNTSHWWSDFVDRLRDRMQRWSSPANEDKEQAPARNAPEHVPSPAPGRNDGDADITESTPALPPAQPGAPAAPDRSAPPPDVDSSPGLAPGDASPAAARTPTPSGWSDIGTPLPPAGPLNPPEDRP